MNAVDLFPHIWQNNYSLLIALFLMCTNKSCSLSEWTDVSEKHPLTLDSCSQWNLKKHFPHIQSPIWDQQSSSRLCISPPSFCSCGFGRVLPFPGWKGLLQRPRNNKFQSWYVALKVQLVFAFKVLPTFIYTEHCNRAETTPSVYVWE